MESVLFSENGRRSLEMDFGFLGEYFSLWTALGCIVVGIVIKHCIKNLDNRWIPPILVVLGGVLNLFLTNFTIEAGIAGMFLGLMSVGGHQFFKQIFGFDMPVYLGETEIYTGEEEDEVIENE